MNDQVQDTATATTDGGGTQEADTTQATATETTTAAEIEYKFDAPEGVELNQEDLGKFTAIAKELKLPADAAKKFVDLAAAREVARAEAFAKQVSAWADEVKADKELGTPENLAAAKRAIDELGTPALRDLLNSSGMGNHPEVVRFALAVGKALSEDKIVAGRTGGNAPPRDAASVLYGSTPTKS